MKHKYTIGFIHTLCTIIVLLCMGGGFSARASHIMGGGFTYTALGNNKYYVLLSLYRDCAGIPLTGNQGVQVSSVNCGYDTTYTFIPVNSCPEVTPVLSGCPYVSTCQGGNLPGVEECQFAAIVKLPFACADWVVSWESCCRNAAITNLVGGSQGALSFYIYCTIDNANGISASSPMFTSLNTPYVCPNQPAFFYAEGAYDPDGDSLHFSLVPPLQTGIGDSIPYITGLSSQMPFSVVTGRAYNGFAYNSSTGEFVVVPNGAQVTVLDFLVAKYRKIGGVWKVIGSVERELQVYVENVNCPITSNGSLPVLKTPTNITGGTMMPITGSFDTTYTFNICAGQKISFTLPCIQADTQNGLIVTTNADSATPGAKVVIPPGQSDSENVQYSWTPSGTQAGIHFISFKLLTNVCPFGIQRTYTIIINVNAGLSATADTVLCPGQTIVLNAAGSSAYTWTSSSSSTPTAGSSLTISPTATTSYYVTGIVSNTCKNKDTIVVHVANSSFTPTVPSSLLNLCMFQNTALSVGASVPGKYKYWWSCVPLGTITSSDTLQYIAIKPTVSSTYYVREQNLQGCTQVDSVKVNVTGVAPDIKLGVAPTVSCLGDSAQLSSFAAVPDAAYCTPSTIYGCTNTNDVDSVIIGGVVLGVNLGCAGAKGYIDYGYVNNTCFNTGSTYNFTLGTALALWDQADYYVWIDYNHNGSFTDTGEWVLAINNPGQGNGKYVNSTSVTIPATAIPGKTHMRVLAIPWPDGPETDLPCATTQYQGEYVDYDINICTSGLTYSWIPSTGLSSSTVANPKASPSVTAIYTLTASSGSCANSDTIKVKVVPNYSTTITPTVDSVCNGNSKTITMATSPAGSYSYKWFVNDTMAQPALSNTNTLTVSPNTGTKYYVQVVSNGGKGCAKLDSSYIKVLPFPRLSISTSPPVLCNTDTLILSAFAIPPASYCSAYAVDGCNDGAGDITGAVDTFFFGGAISYINNANPCPASWANGYTYIRADTSVCLSAGSTYSITLGQGINTPGGGGNSYLVFIDYNHNGLFDTSELVYTSLTSPSTGTITIPQSALPGITRIRLISVPVGDFFTPPSLDSLGCNTTADFEGEVLDYDIKICKNISLAWSPKTGLTQPDSATTRAVITSGTTYTVTEKSLNGTCTNSNSITLKVYVPLNPQWSYAHIGGAYTFTPQDSTAKFYKWYFGNGDSSTLRSPTYTYTVLGMYTVCMELYDNAGCTYTHCDSIRIDTTLCEALFTVDSTDTVTHVVYVTNHSAGTVSLEWVFGDGDSSSMSALTHSYVIGGTYDLCLHIICANGDTSSHCALINGDSSRVRSAHPFTVNIRNAPTGINNITEPQPLKVYPNPVTNMLNVILPTGITSGRICIKNVLGQEIETQEIGNAHAMQFDMSHLAAGMYMIQLLDNSRQFVTKVVKQ